MRKVKTRYRYSPATCTFAKKIASGIVSQGHKERIKNPKDYLLTLAISSSSSSPVVMIFVAAE